MTIAGKTSRNWYQEYQNLRNYRHSSSNTLQEKNLEACCNRAGSKKRNYALINIKITFVSIT